MKDIKSSAVLISGPYNSGKEYVINKYFENYRNVRILSCKCDEFINRDYGALIGALDTYRITRTVGISQEFYMENSVSNNMWSINFGVTKFINLLMHLMLPKTLNRIETDILCKLKMLSLKRKTIVLLKNISSCDDKTAEFLNAVLYDKKIMNTYLKNVLFIATIDSKATCSESIKKILSKRFQQIDFLGISETEFNTAFADADIADEDVYRFYTLVDSDIELMQNVSTAIKSKNLDLNNAINNRTDLVENIITKKMEMLGVQGVYIDEVLKYASLIGICFSLDEIKLCFKDNNEKIEGLCEAESLCLINKNCEVEAYVFARQLIFSIFKNRALLSEKYKLAHLAQEAIQQCNPDKYLERAELYELKNERYNGSIMRAIHCIKNCRENETEQDWEKVLKLPYLTDGDKQCLKQIFSGYFEYNNLKFDSAFRVLQQNITNANVLLKAEKIMLKAKVDSKSYLSSTRNSAITDLVELLSNDKISKEVDIKIRLLIRLTAMYVHTGDLRCARRCENALVHLTDSLSFGNGMRGSLELLNRKSNMLHDCFDAKELMYSAVKHYYPQEYMPKKLYDAYIALGNFVAINIICGTYEEAAAAQENLDFFVAQYKDYPFPRSYIYESNQIILGHLSGKISVSTTLDRYRKFIIEHEKKQSDFNSADLIFYKSNLAILHMLNEDYQSAVNELYKLKNVFKKEIDREGIYEIRINANLLIFEYLNAKSKSDKLAILSKFEELSINNDIDRIYVDNKIKSIIKAMLNDTFYYTPLQWDRLFLSDDSTMSRYYERGFFYTITFNWDE